MNLSKNVTPNSVAPLLGSAVAAIRLDLENVNASTGVDPYLAPSLFLR